MNGNLSGGATVRAGKRRKDSVTRARAALVARGAESGLRCGP
jgi:hypothetical protein